MDAIRIAPAGRSWAVTHNGSYLGHAATRQEAVAVATSLLDWMGAEGRPGRLVVEGDPAPQEAARASLLA